MGLSYKKWKIYRAGNLDDRWKQLLSSEKQKTVELHAISEFALYLSIGGFVRRSVADKEIKEAPPADIPLLLRAMRQAGYNLDQTLKRFNTTNVPDMPQFRKGLEEIRAATKMVSDAYTSDYQ